MKSIVLHSTLYFASLLFLASCAFTKGQFVLETTPTDAEVYLKDGTKLGATPLKMDAEAFKQKAGDNVIALRLVHPACTETELILTPHEYAEYKVKLTELSEEYFKSTLSKSFSKPVNELVRGLLESQGLILLKRLDEAESKITLLQTQYPSFAASYVLLSEINRLKGNLSLAKSFLLRAASLDKTDKTIQRMLGSLGKEE